jgi:hypothetical protein
MALDDIAGLPSGGSYQVRSRCRFRNWRQWGDCWRRQLRVAVLRWGPPAPRHRRSPAWAGSDGRSRCGPFGLSDDAASGLTARLRQSARCPSITTVPEPKNPRCKRPKRKAKVRGKIRCVKPVKNKKATKGKHGKHRGPKAENRSRYGLPVPRRVRLQLIRTFVADAWSAASLQRETAFRAERLPAAMSPARIGLPKIGAFPPRPLTPVGTAKVCLHRFVRMLSELLSGFTSF